MLSPDKRCLHYVLLLNPKKKNPLLVQNFIPRLITWVFKRTDIILTFQRVKYFQVIRKSLISTDGDLRSMILIPRDSSTKSHSNAFIYSSKIYLMYKQLPYFLLFKQCLFHFLTQSDICLLKQSVKKCILSAFALDFVLYLPWA